MELANIVVLGFVISIFVIFALALIYGDVQSSRRARE